MRHIMEIHEIEYKRICMMNVFNIDVRTAFSHKMK